MVRHPDLYGLERLAADAVGDPDVVYDSRSRSSRKLFYHEAVQPLPFTERYIPVVVAYDDLPEGLVGVVVTAYPVNGVSEEDTLGLVDICAIGSMAGPSRHSREGGNPNPGVQGAAGLSGHDADGGCFHFGGSEVPCVLLFARANWGLDSRSPPARGQASRE